MSASASVMGWERPTCALGVSSASGVKLTESDIHNIRQTPADAVILCPDSNAILVRTAESGL